MLLFLELVEDLLDPVDGREDERDRIAGHRHAIAELAHERLGGVRERFEPRQSKKAAGALDRVDKPEDVVQDLGVVRFLLEMYELDVNRIEALACFGQKLAQQIVHESKPSETGASGGRAPLLERT